MITVAMIDRMQTYGIPTISRLLVATQQFSTPAYASKRYADTAILIAEYALSYSSFHLELQLTGTQVHWSSPTLRTFSESSCTYELRSLPIPKSWQDFQ